jgi:hypothetical protein
MPAGDQVGVGDAAGPGQSFGIHDHDSDPQGGTLSPAENKNTLGSPAVQPVRPRAFDFPLMGMYGDGSDGDFDCGGLTQLTKDMNFRNLHVLSGGILYTAGFIFRVFGKLTVDPIDPVSGAPAGVICCDGFDGVDGWFGAPGTGGPGGPSAIIVPKLRILIANWPWDGGAGGDAGPAPGKNVAAGGISGIVTFFSHPFRDIIEPNSGAGGGGIGSAPTAGGNGKASMAGKGGGGPGGTAKIVNAGVNVQDGGGGGGGGGGWMEFWANEIDNAGRITCRGGKGGAGNHTVVGADESYSGNGSGGNGGLLKAFYRKISGAGLGVIDCLGGIAGVGGWAGSPGTNGDFEIIQVGA